MPTAYIETLDDPLVSDGSLEFSGGADLQSDPAVLPGNVLADAINVDISKVATASTRKGTTILDAQLAASRIQGLGELDTTTLERLLAACNNAMFKYDGATWSTAAGYTPTASSQVEMAQGINNLYVVDGTQNMFSWDGTTFVDLGTTHPNPPIASMLAWHTFCLFAAGNTTDRDTLWASNPLTPGAGGWDWATRSIRIGGGDGDSIKAIFSWRGFDLLVFKEHSFYVVHADPSVSPALWVIEKMSPVIGCVAHRTVAQVGNDVYFLSQDGVRTVNRTMIGDQNEVSVPLSWPLQPIIDRINWAQASKFCAISFDNRYMVSVALDQETEPSTVLVYNTRIQKWTGHWTGWATTAFLFSKLGNQKRCLFGDTNGKVYKWNYDADDTAATSFTDNGVAIPTTIKTRAYTHGELWNEKEGWNVDMEFNKSLAVASLYAILDDAGDDLVDLNFDTFTLTNQLPVNLPFDLAVIKDVRKAFDISSLGGYRKIQFKLTSTANKLNLKNIVANGYLNTVAYEA